MPRENPRRQASEFPVKGLSGLGVGSCRVGILLLLLLFLKFLSVLFMTLYLITEPAVLCV